MPLTAAQLCRRLSLAPDDLPALIEQGLPCQGTGKRRRLDESAAREFLAGQAADQAIARTRGEVAQHFGVSERTVATWIREGMPGRSGRPGVQEAHFPLAEIETWIAGRATTDDAGSTKHQAQTRLTIIRAKREELALRREEEELVEAEEVRRRWLRFQHEARAQLEQLVPKLVKTLGDQLTPKRREKLRANITRVINGACQTLELFLEAQASDAESEEHEHDEAEADDGSA